MEIRNIRPLDAQIDGEDLVVRGTVDQQQMTFRRTIERHPSGKIYDSATLDLQQGTIGRGYNGLAVWKYDIHPGDQLFVNPETLRFGASVLYYANGTQGAVIVCTEDSPAAKTIRL